MSEQEIVVQGNNLPAPSSDTQAVLMMIERVACNPEVDMDKFERIIDMQERILKRNGEQAFAADFAAMQSELPRIARNGLIEIKDKNTHKITQSTPFAKLEDINDGVRPILQRYGFGVSFSIDQPPSGITVTAKLLHRLGHSEKTSIMLPIDNSGSKNVVQGNVSTVSYGKRITLCAILNISTGDDIDGHNPGALKIQDDQQDLVVKSVDIQSIRAALLIADYEESKFCKAAGIQKLEDMLLSRMAGALEHIKGKSNASN